jgi:hypothetical protein
VEIKKRELVFSNIPRAMDVIKNLVLEGYVITVENLNPTAYNTLIDKTKVKITIECERKPAQEENKI